MPGFPFLFYIFIIVIITWTYKCHLWYTKQCKLVFGFHVFLESTCSAQKKGGRKAVTCFLPKNLPTQSLDSPGRRSADQKYMEFPIL